MEHDVPEAVGICLPEKIVIYAMLMKTVISFCASVVFLATLPLLPAEEEGKTELRVGSPAPEVSANDQQGDKVALAEAYKQGPVLVYFYPKADTPGCTKQACSLRDAYADLQENGITIYGVSGDSVEAQKAFQDKYELPFTLLSDPEGQVMDAFGVDRRGKFASRQAFLIKDGKIAWIDRKASTAKQAEDVLAVVAEWEKP